MATTGLNQYLFWGAAGASPTALFGIHEEDAELNLGASVKTLKAIGGRRVEFGTAIQPAATIPFVPMDGAILATSAGYNLRPRSTAAAFRAGTLNAMDIIGSNGSVERQFKGCKVNSFTLSSPGEADWMKCKLELLALLRLTDTLSTGTEPAWTIPFTSGQAVVTVGGVDIGVKSWELSGKNNLKALFKQSSTTEDQQRYPDEIVEGDEECEVKLTTYEPIAEATRKVDKDLIKNDLAFSATANNGTQTMTISVTGLTDVEGDKEKVHADDKVLEYEYTLRVINGPLAYAGVAGPTITFASSGGGS